MKIALRFAGNSEPQIELEAETEAEKAILGFLTERADTREWRAVPSFTYRPSGVDKATLTRNSPLPLP